MQRALNIGTFLLLFLLYSPIMMAHGEIHLRIQELSAEIQKSPKNPDLYLKRAVLFSQHHEPKRSNKDLKKCLRLGMEVPQIDFYLAKNYYSLQRFNKSHHFLDQILTNDSLQIEALQLKGLVLLEQKHFIESATYFEKVIDYTQETKPEDYLEAAFAWEQAGMEEKSKAILQRGLSDLGNLLVFHQKLVELALKTQNFEEAIAQQTKIIDLSNRKEKAYYERALIYLQNKQEAKAKIDLELSLQLLEKLPTRIKGKQTSIELKNSIIKTSGLL